MPFDTIIGLVSVIIAGIVALVSIRQSMVRQNNDLTTRLEKQTNDLATKLERQVADLADKLEKHTADMAARLAEKTKSDLDHLREMMDLKFNLLSVLNVKDSATLFQMIDRKIEESRAERAAAEGKKS